MDESKFCHLACRAVSGPASADSSPQLILLTSHIDPCLPCVLSAPRIGAFSPQNFYTYVPSIWKLLPSLTTTPSHCSGVSSNVTSSESASDWRSLSSVMLLYSPYSLNLPCLLTLLFVYYTSLGYKLQKGSCLIYPVYCRNSYIQNIAGHVVNPKEIFLINR